MHRQHRIGSQFDGSMMRMVFETLVSSVALVWGAIQKLQPGLLGILITTATIVYVDRLPLVPLGGISLQVPDLLLLGSLGLIAIRWLIVPGFHLVRTPLDRPLLVFVAVTMLSTLIGLWQSALDMHEALRAIRVFSYYLAFFLVTNSVRERRQVLFLGKAILLLATGVAAAMIAQYLLGDSVNFLPGRVETLNTKGTTFDAVTRICPPGFSLVVVSFLITCCTLAFEKVRPAGLLRILQCGILGTALLITFLRSYWASLIVVLIVLLFLLRGVSRKRLVGLGIGAACSGVFLLLVAFVAFDDPDSLTSKLFGASWDRLSSLGNSGTFQGQDSSVEWRMTENGYAFSAIADKPVLGLGMGAIYRPWDSRLDFLGSDGLQRDFRRLIHNSYLTILLQSGFLGLLSLLWLSVAFVARGLRNWRDVADHRLRGLVLGSTLAYVTVLLAGVTNSTFMQWNWVPVIGIMMGLNEVIIARFRNEARH